jgi:Tol biopolymer transport system component
VRDVIDLDSMLSYYLVDHKKIKTTPELAQKDRLETYPTWSPDGRYLYFCSAPLTWTSRDIIPADYREVKYNLVRIGYDLDRDQWGKLETMIASQDTGLSTLVPRISPDGRWLLVCMADYGCFPVYQNTSDLYVIDLARARQTGAFEPRRLSINSNASESWHSWSSNSRWIAFSSKRECGAFTRCYLCYFDENGKAHKPFVLPQGDPGHYDSCLWTYSVPEMICKPVHITREKLGRVIRSSQKMPVDMPVTAATPKVTPSAAHANPWLSERE